jgi:hypothetical protein
VSTGELVTLLENGGTIIVFLALLVTEVLVPKSRLDEMKAERDEWKRMAELNGARADAGVLAGQAARDVFRALHEAAAEDRTVKELE